MYQFKKISKIFIKNSDGEDLPEDKRVHPEHWYFWDVEKHSIHAMKKLGTFKKGDL